MNRTSDRPLPAGRVDVGDALLLGLGAAACGLTLLVVLVNGLTALLSLTSLVLYVVVYTPLKQKTSFHTLIGAVTGALPPVMGWAAATGQAPREAWILFGILFVWQLPHFFAIAWLYREDYARAGMRMLSVMDEGGKMAIRQVLLFSLTLLPVSLLPSTVAMAGEVYLFAALLLGTALVAAALTLIRRPDARRARNVYLMSLVYLPCLLGVMVLDRWTLA
jgi:protoheme IX farnesyltransferase